MKFLRLSFILLLIGVILLPSAASAISPKELHAILRNTAYYGDFDGSGTCGDTVSEGSGPERSGDNPEKAFNYFKGKGLTDIQAAAIVANLIAESGVKPKSNQGGGGPGRGIAQWTASERWATLEKWAKGPIKTLCCSRPSSTFYGWS